MTDFQELSRFTPALRPLEISPWYDEYAVRAKGAFRYHFVSGHEKVLIDRIRRNHLAVGELNETIYGLTNKISPLRVIQFLFDIDDKGLLENGDELRAILPEVSAGSRRVRRPTSLMTIRGIDSKPGVIFSLLFFACMVVLGLLNNGIPSPPSLYPFPDNFLYSILAIPAAVLFLYNLRGIFSLITFFFLGVKGNFVLGFECCIPVLSMGKRAVISAPPARRRLYYVMVAMFFPFIITLLSTIHPYVPDQFAAILMELFWVSAVLLLFDIYLLRDSILIVVCEEFSRESALAEKFKTFWKHGFVTIESLSQKKFSKEELFFGIGILQLLWFFGYGFIALFVLRESMSQLVRLSLARGAHVFVPWALMATLGGIFFFIAFISFVLKKTAGVTVSLVDLSSIVIGKKKGRAGLASDILVDLKEIHIFSLVSDDELKWFEERVAVSKHKAGKRLIKQGELGDSLFAIRKGKVLIYKRGDRGEDEKLAFLREGDVFGERAILGDGKRTASVKSLTPVDLYVIPKEVFAELSEGLGERSKISEIIMAANAIQSTPVFSEMPPQTVLNFASHVALEKFSSGSIILKEGDKSNGALYIIKRGEATVLAAGPDGKDVILEANDFFGEIALLNDSLRTATVMARTDIETFALGKEDFLDVLFSNLGSLLALETKGRKRLSELTGSRA